MDNNLTNLPTHTKKLNIIHFNDVYNIEENPKTKVSAARFVTAFDLYDSKNKLTLFSGDLFFPSNLSTYYEGEQMIKPFNRLNVDISCLGNHELDNGIEKCAELIAQTNCPWILSNLLETEKGNRPISGVEPCRIVEHQGFKIGCIGFSDEAWTDQFNPDINCDILKYVDYNESLRKYSKILKEQGADLIIALNHMRKPEDLDMAQ